MCIISHLKGVIFYFLTLYLKKSDKKSFHLSKYLYLCPQEAHTACVVIKTNKLNLINFYHEKNSSCNGSIGNGRCYR